MMGLAPLSAALPQTLEECLGGFADTCHGQDRHSSLPPPHQLQILKFHRAAGVQGPSGRSNKKEGA